MSVPVLHTAGERPRIVELSRARRTDAAALAADAWDLPPAPGVIEARLSAPNARVIAAMDPRGRLVGVATARILGAGRAVSDETAVHPSWRRRGVAAAMIEALSVMLRGRGIRVLEGESSGKRRRELAFFRRQGFRVTGVWIAHGVEGYAEGETIYRTEKRLRGRAASPTGCCAAASDSGPARRRRHRRRRGRRRLPTARGPSEPARRRRLPRAPA